MAAITTVTPDSKRSPQRVGTRLEWNGKITGPASYDTGGSVLDAKLFGFTQFMGGGAFQSGGRTFEVIIQSPPSTAKLKAYVGTTGVEVASTTDISASVPWAILHGR